MFIIFSREKTTGQRGNGRQTRNILVRTHLLAPPPPITHPRVCRTSPFPLLSKLLCDLAIDTDYYRVFFCTEFVVKDSKLVRVFKTEAL